MDLIQRGYTGIEVRDRHLWVSPRPPEGLSGLRIRVRLRGQRLEPDIRHDLVRVRAVPPVTETIRIGLDSEAVSLQTCQILELKRERTPLFVDAP